MFTQYGYVRNEMAKAYVRNMLAAQFLGRQRDEDENAARQSADAA